MSSVWKGFWAVFRKFGGGGLVSFGRFGGALRRVFWTFSGKCSGGFWNEQLTKAQFDKLFNHINKYSNPSFLFKGGVVYIQFLTRNPNLRRKSTKLHSQEGKIGKPISPKLIALELEQ